jgi:hypothetical protein
MLMPESRAWRHYICQIRAVATFQGLPARCKVPPSMQLLHFGVQVRVSHAGFVQERAVWRRRAPARHISCSIFGRMSPVHALSAMAVLANNLMVIARLLIEKQKRHRRRAA